MRKIIYLLALAAAIGAFNEQRTDIMGGDIAEVQALPDPVSTVKGGQGVLTGVAISGFTCVGMGEHADEIGYVSVQNTAGRISFLTTGNPPPICTTTGDK